MIKSFFLSRKWAIWAWGGFLFIIGSLLAQTWIDVKINEWYKGFYDLLQKATESCRELQKATEILYISLLLFVFVCCPMLFCVFPRTRFVIDFGRLLDDVRPPCDSKSMVLHT